MTNLILLCPNKHYMNYPPEDLPEIEGLLFHWIECDRCGEYFKFESGEKKSRDVALRIPRI